jgi:hypothetical protein
MNTSLETGMDMGCQGWSQAKGSSLPLRAAVASLRHP